LDTIQLQALGFDLQIAIEAYFLTDRNEEQAIYCLIANPNGIGNSGFLGLSLPCLMGPLVLDHFTAVRWEAPVQVPNHATSRTVGEFALTGQESRAITRVSSNHAELLAKI
jgi:hypothetical protein